jgi:hypothetical protein
LGKDFIGEHLEKEGQSIELACKDVNFDAEDRAGFGSSYKINVVNRGNVPIYGLEIRKKGLGSVDTIKTVGNGAETITAGESAQLDLTGATSGAQYLLVPVLLGESEDYTNPISVIQNRERSSVP